MKIQNFENQKIVYFKTIIFFLMINVQEDLRNNKSIESVLTKDAYIPCIPIAHINKLH